MSEIANNPEIHYLSQPFANPGAGYAPGEAPVMHTGVGTDILDELSTEVAILRYENRHLRTDGLTKLLRREVFLEAMRHELHGPATVLVIDLDNLKMANDQEGHAAGDKIIEAAATTLRESDNVRLAGRAGGDEFYVLLRPEDALNEEELQIIIERLRDTMTTNGVSASIGGVLRNPHEPVDELIARADTAMRRDKIGRRLASIDTQPRSVHDALGALIGASLGTGVSVRTLASFAEALMHPDSNRSQSS